MLVLTLLGAPLSKKKILTGKFKEDRKKEMVANIITHFGPRY
jgi:hypothetical protein